MLISRRGFVAGSGAMLAASPLRAMVSFSLAGGAFPIFAGGRAATIIVGANDYPGVLRAARDLGDDIGRVCGTVAAVVSADKAPAIDAILVGTLGRGGLIDQLARDGKIDVRSIRGNWESCLVQTIEAPVAGIARALVVAGSDKRGTIYGLYELSQNMGVSPWYWWADVPVARQSVIAVTPGRYVQGPPTVKYRGIFLNDEAPCLSGWTAEKFGGMNAKFYTKLFELLLRLRANYLWPAMWGNAFNDDDPANPALADEYGIVMGTSHHEPMMRAHQEWTKRRQQYGNGEWNYATNKEALQRFFREGIAAQKSREKIVTIGMRGDGDRAMTSTGSLQSDIAQLERIMADQRRIIGEVTQRDPAETPQLWALFTEVLKYYDGGLKVPDDVTLLFADDNVGDLRRLPNAQERKRAGGSGIYFHMDMNGGPFSYKWLNSNPLPKIWEQMNLAVEYGADRIWIVNVGDLKPLELPIDFFLRFAWDASAIRKEDVGAWTAAWAARQFGAAHATEIGDILAKYAKYNGNRKPELVKPDTFSLENYREAERVVEAWRTLAARAERIRAQLPADAQDAFYQLVLHPVLACGNMVEMQVAARRNEVFAKQGRASTNDEARNVRALFAKDAALSAYYNRTLAGGKWNHLMDQVHLGYYSWFTPPKDIMPAVSELAVDPGDGFGVAIEGNLKPDGGALPVLDSLNGGRTYIEVFPTGTGTPSYRVTADQPWVIVAEGDAFSVSKRDRRFWIDVDWTRAPAGSATATVSVAGAKQRITAELTARKATPAEARAARGAFGGLAGPIAIAPARAARNVRVGGVGWEPIPDYGRVDAAMSIFPVTAETIEQGPAPSLEYSVFLTEAGSYEVQLVTGPTLDVIPTRKLGIRVGFDDMPATRIDVFTPENFASEDFLGKAFGTNVRNNARVLTSRHRIESPGVHRLIISMIDPTIVLQKIIVSRTALPPSYFGPPERGPNGQA